MSSNTNTNTNTRCCSFCKIPGHNIKSCNNIDLLIFHKDILIMRNLMLQAIAAQAIAEQAIAEQAIEEQAIEQEQPNLFINYLRIQPDNLINTLAVKECNILARDRNKNKEDCINAINFKYYQRYYNYFINSNTNLNTPINRNINIKIYLNEEIEKIDQVINPNPNHIPIPIPVPDQEEDFDLISVSTYNSSDDDNEITWTIDRTGTNINIMSKHDITLTLINIRENLLNECNICYESYSNNEFIKLQCNHEFCHDCISKQLQNNKASCAFCRQDMKQFDIYDTNIYQQIHTFIKN